MCERCDKLEDHIADLRNKYGRIYAYFQFLELVKEDEESYSVNPFLETRHKEMLEEAEKTIIEDNKRFVELLKTEI